jgi:hypothetical protein
LPSSEEFDVTCSCLFSSADGASVLLPTVGSLDVVVDDGETAALVLKVSVIASSLPARDYFGVDLSISG